jgi:hypothetical protein
MQWKKNQSDLQENVSVRVPFLSVCFLLLLVCMGVTAQTNYKISGTVVAAKDSEPLIGVNVLQKGTTNGIVTDIDGNLLYLFLCHVNSLSLMWDIWDNLLK